MASAVLGPSTDRSRRTPWPVTFDTWYGVPRPVILRSKDRPWGGSLESRTTRVEAEGVTRTDVQNRPLSSP
jgi:hypothetical protein